MTLNVAEKYQNQGLTGADLGFSRGGTLIFELPCHPTPKKAVDDSLKHNSQN